MTWVIGRAGPFGYAVGLSDIRITLQNKTELDCLQKIYKISPMMALGFAGSVAIGFEIVNVLRAALHIATPNVAWDPSKVAEFFPIGTRDVFDKAKPEEKRLGCQLIMLSAHPTENDGSAPWARCFVHTFSAPDFTPKIANSAEIVSIGSGSNVPHYTNTLRNLESDYELFNLEADVQGGLALGLMMSVTSAIKKVPVGGISNHLHICLVGRDGIMLGMNDSTAQDNAEDDFLMPPVAQSWNELKEILRQAGNSSAQIECVRC